MKRTRLAALLLAGALAAMTPLSALALTPACQPIANTASVDYAVGGNTQTPKTGTVSFNVGNKINLTVLATLSTYVTVIPGETNRIIEFTVINTGNATQDYGLSLTHIADPFGGTDNFDAGVLIFEDHPTLGTVGTYDSNDTRTYIDELPAATEFNSRKVFVIYSAVALTRVNNDISAISLLATTKAGGVADTESTTETAGAANACGGTAPTVFADTSGTTSGDATNDGKHSDDGAYKVVTATLTVAKTTTVYYDPVNCSSLAPLTCGGAPKLIPGARFTYEILVTNTGAAHATYVAITDSLAAEIVAGRLNFLTPYDEDITAGSTCGLSEGLYVNGFCKTNADDIEVPLSKFISNVVTVEGLTVNSGGGTASIKFQVEIQ